MKLWDDFVEWAFVGGAESFSYRAFKLVLLVFGPPLTFLVSGLGWLAAYWFAGVAMWGLGWLVAWAVRIDRDEKLLKKLNEDYRTELGALDERIKSQPKQSKKEPSVRNSNGEPMTCILCSEWTNSGGRYCDEHDDHLGKWEVPDDWFK